MDKKQTALVPLDAKTLKQGYWARVSHAYSFVFHALLFVLPLFVIVFMALCAQAFTRNSVFGFGKDLLSVPSFLSSDYQTVYYTYEEGERSVLAYRDGVAVVNSAGIKVYSPDSARLLDKNMRFTAPRAAASDKYLIAYDFASTAFSVTNGYSVLFEGETDFPILDAAVADTGHFAIVTSSQTHLSQVLLYDANFNLIQRFSRTSATTDVCISSNGKYVAFCALTTENGAVQSIVEAYRIGAREPTFSIRIADAALALSFTDARHLMLVTPTAGYALDLDGKQAKISFGGHRLVGYDVAKDGCAFLLNVDNTHEKSRVIVCDKRGDTVRESDLEQSFTAVAVGESHVYLLSEDALWRVEIKDGGTQTLAVQTGAEAILLTDGEQLRLVRDGAAEYVEFD